MRGLRRRGHRVTLLPSLAVAARTLFRATGRPPLLVLDPWTLDELRRLGLVDRATAARCLVLDSFGTAPAMLPPRLGLRTRQYLTPYPTSARRWNTFLGYVHDPSGPARSAAAMMARVRACLRDKKPQGVVWGKEARYFEPVAPLLRRLASVCPLHATVAPERGLRKDTLPPGVVNHGFLERHALQALLRDSSFVIGLGDPVEGPMAIDALAAGCVYVNPRYARPRLVNGIHWLPIASQHPFAARIGRPFVHTVPLTDRPAIRRAVEASFDRRALLRALDGAAGRRLRAGLGEFTRTRYDRRLRAILAGMRAARP